MPTTYLNRRVIFAPLAAILIASPSALAQPLDWHKFTSTSASPGARSGHAIAYDAARKQVVLFGGNAGIADLNDTWVWDGTNWSSKSSSSNPSPRSSHVMAYDAKRQEVVLFGGVIQGTNGSTVNAETWVWNGTTWTKRNPAHVPTARDNAAMAYDAERQQVVLFGGENFTPSLLQSLNDTWTWDGTDWTQQSPANDPGRRNSHAMAYDAGRKQTVLYGGNTGDTQTWLWDGTNWTANNTSSNPGILSQATRMAYDATLGLVVLYGGIGENGKTWTWDGTTWTQQTLATAPPAVYDHAMAYDADAGKTVMFGGSISGSIGTLSSDTWLLYGTLNVNVTITSATSGATFSVTGTGCQPGTGYTVPKTLQWTPGSSCSVSFTSPVSGSSGTQFVFTNWNDNSTSNPRTFSAPASATTYTANYKTQYQLITAISPAGAGTVTGAGFYDANTSATVTATAAANYRFAGWTPALSPNTASSTVAMTAPKTVSANFAIITSTSAASASGQYSDVVTLSATIGPSGSVFSGSLQFQVDGVNAGAAVPVSGAGTYTTSYTIALPAGPHTISAALTSSTSIALDSNGTSPLTVTKEDATITLDPTNPQTAQPGPVTLKATIAQAADGSLGDINKAAVTVTLVPTVGSTNINCPVTNTAGALTASCPSLPVNVYSAQWVIGGNFFTGPTATGSLNVVSAVTITSAVTGATFSVTGTGCQPGASYTVPQTLQWTLGSTCVVTFANLVSGTPGTQYVFTGWQDGSLSNPRTFSAPSSGATYTANYKTQYQLTTSVNPAGTGTVTGAGFYDAGTSAAVTATPASGLQFTGWTPALSPNTASSTVAMTGPKSVTANFSIVTGTTVAPATGQYSDPVTLSATIAPAGAVFSGSLQFQVDGVNAGAAISVNGAGTYTTSYTITLPAGPHTITAVFTPSTPIALGSSGTSTLTVTKEDSTITLDPTNPQAIQTGPVTLRATIDQAADGSLGDITKAVVTVTLVPVVGTGNINCPVTNTAGALTASCPTLPVNAYNVQWAIGGNYFTGPTVSAKLGVTSPNLGFVNGTGTVVINSIRSDFSAYLLNQAGSLQGGLQFTQHQPTGDVTVATTTLISVSIVGKTAVLLARATINGAGDFPLQAILTDNVAQPVLTRDQFGLQAGSISFAPVAIAFGGDIQVN